MKPPRSRPDRHARDLAAAGGSEARPAPACPRCNSRENEVLSLFGTHLLLLQYRCADCGHLFEASKY